MLLVPIVLAAAPVRTVAAPAAHRSFSVLLAWLGAWKRGRALAVVGLSLLLMVPALYCLRQVQVGTNSLDYFRAGDPVRTDTEWIDSEVGGTTSLEFFIEADGEGAIDRPELLGRMDRFQAYLAGVDGISKVFSVTDIVKTLNRAFHDGRQSEFRIPDSAAQVAQELLVVEGSADLDELVSSQRDRARITARVELGASRRLAHRMPEVEAEMRRVFGDSARVTPTGLVYLMHEMEGYLLTSQMRSFLLAFAVISLAMAVTLRSLGLGVLAMVPNLLPVVFVLALMPLLGISLDVGT